MEETKYTFPDSFGRFGIFGGKYVPETLMNALTELEACFHQYAFDASFKEEYLALLQAYSGRPTSLYYAENLSKFWGGQAKIYLKREDLNHTGAHKINNALGKRYWPKNG